VFIQNKILPNCTESGDGLKTAIPALRTLRILRVFRIVTSLQLLTRLKSVKVIVFDHQIMRFLFFLIEKWQFN
jgi:hypothetical protein